MRAAPALSRATLGISRSIARNAYRIARNAAVGWFAAPLSLPRRICLLRLNAFINPRGKRRAFGLDRVGARVNE